MNQPAIVAIIVVVSIAIVAVVAFIFYRKRRTEQLQNSFGPEYDRALMETGGDKARAEAGLDRRKKRVEGLTIRTLTREDAARYTEAWTKVQALFVDDPKGAVREADQLLGDVMSRRGYPVGDFEQRAEDISVDHPKVVENYRAAHAIALRHAKGEATTEDLRQAMIHYRALFDDLVGHREMTTAKEPEAPAEQKRRSIL